MASCQYGQIAGGTCGSSVDNPANVKSVVLAKCTKAIEGHLRPYNVRDATLVSESKLLLARAGMCVVHLQNICNASFYIYSLAGTISLRHEEMRKKLYCVTSSFDTLPRGRHCRALSL